MRILALVLPDLACELAALNRESRVGVAGALSLSPALAVVIADDAAEVKATTPLFSVTGKARRFGVCPGQTVAAARGLVADLDVRRVAKNELDRALARCAEMALAFGPTASFEAPDTVWVDITGAAHLAGGESALLAELCERVRTLGHRVRGAIAGSAVVAQAVARYAPVPQSVVPERADAAALAPLPVRSLPLDDATASWLVRLGVMTVGDLATLPADALGDRLGDSGVRVLTLVRGEDATPLVAYSPPRELVEEMTWDDTVEGVDPLIFAVRGLLSRLSARMDGRGEATRTLVLTLLLDQAAVPEGSAAPEIVVRVELPAPLSHTVDLLRIVRPKLEALVLPAPVRGVRLVATRLTRAVRTQLDFARNPKAAPEALAVLLGELASELGDDRVGTLSPRNSHVPEACTKLTPVLFDAVTGRVAPSKGEQLSLWAASEGPGIEPPTRLLPEPVPVRGKLVEDGFITIENVPFRVQHIEATGRLTRVSWWTKTPTSRDYARVWLVASQGGAEAWVMRDKRRGGLYVHGWYV